MARSNRIFVGPLAAMAVAAALMVGCSQDEPKAPEAKAPEVQTPEPEKPPTMKTLEGKVAVSEPVEFAPAASAVVSLLDVSKQDVKADTIAETKMEVTALPADYKLSYDPAKLQPNMRYVLRAQVTQAGQLAYTTTDSIAVTGRETSIDLLVSKVGGDSLAAPGPSGSWEATTIIGRPEVKPGSTLVFGADGKVSGNGSCNSFSGVYKLTGTDGLEFGPLAATRMACVPEVAEQENIYFKALAEVRKWHVDQASGILSLMGGSGGQLVGLSAK